MPGLLRLSPSPLPSTLHVVGSSNRAVDPKASAGRPSRRLSSCPRWRPSSLTEEEEDEEVEKVEEVEEAWSGLLRWRRARANGSRARAGRARAGLERAASSSLSLTVRLDHLSIRPSRRSQRAVFPASSRSLDPILSGRHPHRPRPDRSIATLDSCRSPRLCASPPSRPIAPSRLPGRSCRRLLAPPDVRTAFSRSTSGNTGHVNPVAVLSAAAAGNDGTASADDGPPSSAAASGPAS
jgi:hypothetical protein